MPDFTSSRLFRFLAIVCRLWLAAILLYAAVPKLQDPAAFAKAITNYHMVLPIVGMNYVYPMALFLPAMEAVIGVLLILGFWRRGASLLVATIMLVFIAALASALARNLNIDCGCFGLTERGAEIAHKVGLNRLLEDVAYLFMASVVFWEAVVSRKRRVQE
ncbi:DoxX family membrane protein [bacterium]|nr:DoxX family membrane protein [bacterium]